MKTTTIFILLLSFTTPIMAEEEVDFELPSGISGSLFENSFTINDIDLDGKLIGEDICFYPEDAEELALCALENDMDFARVRARSRFPTSPPTETTPELIKQLATQTGQSENVVRTVLDNLSSAIAITLVSKGEVLAINGLGYFDSSLKNEIKSKDSKGNLFLKEGYREVKFKLSKDFSALDLAGQPLLEKPKKQFVAYADGSSYPPTSIPGLAIVGLAGTHKKGSGHLKYTLPATISWQAPTEEYGTPTTLPSSDGQVTVCSSVVENCVQLDVIVSQLPTSEVTKSVKFLKEEKSL